MFDLHQIEQFLAVVECGTVSKAAEKMNITQPALSRSLQNLEYELKTPLFTLQTEHLFAQIPENHPLASKNGVKFSEINGEAVVPLPLKGHWTRRRRLPIILPY